jgi:hypothetical protein
MLENGILHKLDITGVYFTLDGKTWFGTSGGLASFDGNDFRVYPVDSKNEDDINPERIYAFAEDKDGFIWTFSNNHILSKFNPKTSSYEKVDFLKGSTFPDSKIDISALYFDRENKLWIGSANFGFFIYDPASGKSEHYNLDNTKQGMWYSRYGNSAKAFLQDSYDSSIMWIAGYGSGIFSFNKKTPTVNKKFRAENANDSFWRDNCITAMAIKNKSIWFGTWGMGIGEYNTQTGLYKMYSKNSGFYFDYVGKEVYTHGHIVTQLIQKSANEYIVALADSLPAVFNTTTKKFNYLKDAQLARTIDRVTNIGTNKQNTNTWFLKGGKLYITSPQYNIFRSLKFNSKNLRYRHGIGDVVWNEKNKSYYVGANYSEGIHVFDESFTDKKIISMPSYNGKGIINASTSWRVRFDRTDRLWSMGYIFCVYDSTTGNMIEVEKKYPSIKELKKTFIDFTTDANGNLVLMSADREIIFFNVVTQAAHTVKLPKNKYEKKVDFEARNVLIDTLRNLIYVCDGQAIFQYNINKKTFRTVEYYADAANGLPAANVSGYALDFDGNLWIGTRGIYIYEPVHLKLIKRITAKENLTDNVNISLLRGPPGYMFFFTPKGGNLYSLHDSSFVHFDMNNGMASENLSGYSYANHRIFLNIGLYTSMNQYTDVASILTLQKQIIPYVSGIKIINKKIETDTIPEFLSRLQLPFNQNSLTLTFSSVEFEFPERVEYSYKLDGLENDWTVTDYMNRTVTYTNLTPGDYTFRVRARMLGGKWSEVKSPLNIFIVPAFWQTLWFKLLSVLAVALIIYYLVWQRITAVRKREKLRTIHEKELIGLEAQALRAQMNPHFIFNCLNSIKALIQKNENDTAADYLTTFSKLIRTLFQHSDAREVSLYEEIETCKLYTQLEALRFKNKVSFSFDVEECIDLKDIKVPALILQPFIENAIWHGLVPKETGGHVKISISQIGDSIQCKVDDDGIGRELSKLYQVQYNSTHQSRGISLTHSRLNIDRLLNGREEEIEILDKKDAMGNAAGTTAILTLKKIK